MDSSPITEETFSLLLLDALLAIVAVVVIGALLVKASRYRGAARFIGPLAVLSAVAMVLGAIAEQDALIAIGAGGVGAIGAVLQSVMRKEDNEEVDERDG